MKGREGFVLLGVDLWEQEWLEIAYTVAHEVANAFLEHKCTFETTDSEKGAKAELEADNLAMEWLTKHFDSESLLKMSYEGRGQIKDGRFT